MSKEDLDSIFEIFSNKYNIKIGKFLGKGGNGEVREVIYKGETFAGKLIQSENYKIDIISALKGPNIVNICENFVENLNSKTYLLFIMEKALKDLSDFHKSLSEDFSLINNVFIEKIGDNLLKFLVKQIIDGLEQLERNEYLHFDIKPENILVYSDLSIKLSDFGLLREVSNIENIYVPGGTPGFLSPEYYHSKHISVELAKKMDYFSLGSTIFFLKYGKLIYKICKEDNKREIQENIIYSIPKAKHFIQSKNKCNRDFVNFLCDLIETSPNSRPSFEEIYRNRWVNKNLKFIKKLLEGHGEDEQKFIMEIKKSDYLFRKKKCFENSRKNKKKFIFKKF